MDVDRMFFDDLGKKIHLKDNRAIKDWCKKHDVLVIEAEPRHPYVLRSQFEEKYDIPSIQALQQAFPDDWHKYAQKYDDNPKDIIVEVGNDSINNHFSGRNKNKNESNLNGNKHSGANKSMNVIIKQPIIIDEEFLKEVDASKSGKVTIQSLHDNAEQTKGNSGDKPPETSTKNKRKQNLLSLSPKDKALGLHIWCNNCKGRYKGKCHQNKNRKCKHPHRHTYRLEVRFTDRERIFDSKSFKDITDEQEAKELARKLRKIYLQSGDKSAQEKVKNQQIRTHNLKILMAIHMAYLKDMGMESFEKKNRGERFIERVDGIYKFMLSAIRKNGFRLQTFSVYHFDQRIKTGETIRAKIHDEILLIPGKDGPIKNPTINDYINTYRGLFRWGIDKKYIDINPFENVKPKQVNYVRRNDIITADEYKNLIAIINTMKVLKVKYDSGSKNCYKDYLADGISLGLFTGFRAFQVVMIRFSNIILEGEILFNSFIEVENFKINNDQNLIREEEKMYNYVRINHDLEELLLKLDYEQFKNTDYFILARESSDKRQTIQKILSDGFREYFKLTNPKKKLAYKNLRKSHITYFANEVGLDLASKSFHSRVGVTRIHYINNKVSIPNADEFPRIFG